VYGVDPVIGRPAQNLNPCRSDDLLGVDNGAMVNRRLLLLAALLLLVASVAGALTPREDRKAKAPPARASTPLPRVSATLPGAGPVQARVGDLVSLRVRSRTQDEAELAAFGLTQPVGPDVVGEFTFVADRPGRFPVHLSLADTDAGTVVVRRR